MSENPWQQRNQIGKSSEETRAGKYIKIGFLFVVYQIPTWNPE